MPDLLDPLRDLPAATLPGPESIDQLRDRTARRHRRQRVGFVPIGVVATIAVVALIAGRGPEGGERGVETVDRPDLSTPTTAPAATTVPAEPTTTVAAMAPATELRALADVDAIEGWYSRIVADRSGVVAPGPDDRPDIWLTDQPALLGFGVDAPDSHRVVVAQLEASGSPGPIVVFEGTSVRELVPVNPPQTGGTVRLYDAGVLDGAATAVISISSGANPENWDERLYLVRLDTAERTDLGSVGHWEEGVTDARLLRNGDVALLVEGNTRHALELRGRDGSTRWEVPSLGDIFTTRSVTLFATQPEAVWVVEPSFDPDDSPRVVVRSFDPATGAEGELRDVPLVLGPGVRIEGGFCVWAEAAALALLCDQSAGPALRIDLLDGGTRVEAYAPDHGTMTFWRYPI